MLRLTVFEIFTANWQKNRCLRGQKWSTQTPFLTPHLVTPKVIATKGGENRSGHTSTVLQTFMPIGRTIAEISVTKQKIQRPDNTRIYDKTHTSVAFVA